MLQDYTVEHFSEEQDIMAASGYPKLEQHMGLHDRFIKDYLSIRKRWSLEGRSRQLAEQLKKHVGAWLIAHVGVADMEFSEYYHDRSKPVQLAT